MNAIFFLRSYGDFIVALYALRNKKGIIPFKLYASSHLQPLFDALPIHLVPEEVKIIFVDLGISHDLLSSFTDRFLFTPVSLEELLRLRKKIKALEPHSSTEWFLEQVRRILLLRIFTGKPLKYIHGGGNIYRSYNNFFNSNFLATDQQPVSSEFGTKKEVQQRFIIVFPDSRKKLKALPPELVNKLERSGIGQCSIKTAYFKKIPNSFSVQEKNYPASIVYSNFAELISLIKLADFIITADSLPAHLSQLLNKPHWIFYNKKINAEWLTPYSEEKGAYGCFHEYEKLKLFLKGCANEIH